VRANEGDKLAVDFHGDGHQNRSDTSVESRGL
jgi:hypothetical protein